MTEINNLEALRRDLKMAAKTLSSQEARYLVDMYYLMQEDRKRTHNQVRAMEGEPTAVIAWLADNCRRMENWVKGALDAYSANHPVGEWARSIHGIGPVIAAGLLAHIDITRAPTAGHIWSFAGLVPGQKWEKGERRPFNAALKTLCWKIGESFVKVSGNEKAFYGQIYLQRKALEVQRNEAGAFEEQAAEKLKKFRIGKDTDAYKHYSNGRLPPAHLHSRAKRYAVKLFLAHYHETAYREQHGKAPPNPYPVAHLDHAHIISAPS